MVLSRKHLRSGSSISNLDAAASMLRLLQGLREILREPWALVLIEGAGP